MARLVSKQTGSPAKGADQVVTRGRWKLRIGAAAIMLFLPYGIVGTWRMRKGR